MAPRCVATLWIQRVGRRLTASDTSPKHVPDVPIDAVLARDFGLRFFELSLGALVGDPFEHRVRVQVAEAS
jgi:hypothetical protein